MKTFNQFERGHILDALRHYLEMHEECIKGLEASGHADFALRAKQRQASVRRSLGFIEDADFLMVEWKRPNLNAED